MPRRVVVVLVLTGFAALPGPLQPGPHRMVKTVDGPDGELTLYAPFDVLTFSAR